MPEKIPHAGQMPLKSEKNLFYRRLSLGERIRKRYIREVKGDTCCQYDAERLDFRLPSFVLTLPD